MMSAKGDIMKNVNYLREMASANIFVANHEDDKDFIKFMREMEEAEISHSERWSRIYDYMNEHYPGTTGSLITGLCYWCEA